VALTPGTRLGPYEILSALGAGAMGEVYRARDSRLRRDVAIKVLPVAFSADVDRLQRFEQEAHAAAALNHPNILAVHDIGTEAGAPFIVSELLEGATLRDRLHTGAVPFRKAAAYAAAIARGLAAAHEKGIIHRDLKPENLFITTDDRVKILDFGLAKLTIDPAASVSQTAAQTEPGAVLGTVGYMAPEQVRGLVVDQRADVFALGLVFYELVSGQRAFRRETAAETMAAIVNDQPSDLRAHDRPIPPAVTRIIERCLEKSPAARFQTATDLAFALEWLSDDSGSANTVSPAQSARADRRAWIAWGVTALLLTAVASIALQHLRERPPVANSTRFQIPATVELAVSGNVGLSPDGRHLAFLGLGSDGIVRLWIRAMDSLAIRPLVGTETGGSAPPFFWSPDSRFIAFDAGGKLKKIDVAGGPPQTVCDLPATVVGGSWNRDGDIILGNSVGGVLRVRETGGAAIPITALVPSRKEDMHLLPSFLPDGRHFVYLRTAHGTPENSGTYVGTIDATPEAQPAQPLMPYAIGLAYAPPDESGSGQLVFVREGTLVAQPFDAARLALTGDPLMLAQQVGSYRDTGFFAISANGVLVYRTVDTDAQVTWFDRQGNLSGRASEPGRYRSAALSADGTHVAVSRANPQDTSKADLWLIDLSRGSGATRFTLGGSEAVAEFPIWSSDGTRVLFSFRNSSIYQKLASGERDEEDMLHASTARLIKPTSMSPDGHFLLYAATDQNTTRWGLWVVPANLATNDLMPAPVPFAHSAFDTEQGRFSPDGRWVAYMSNDSGAYEVYVRAFTADFSGGSASAGGSVLVSRGGGSAPRWRGDGKELFYLAPDGKMMRVEVAAGQEFRGGTPVPLFQTPPGAIVGDVTADGKRFLLVTPVGQSAAPFTVVLNWMAGLKK
jgi:WD40 repeat protein